MGSRRPRLSPGVRGARALGGKGCPAGRRGPAQLPDGARALCKPCLAPAMPACGAVGRHLRHPGQLRPHGQRVPYGVGAHTGLGVLPLQGHTACRPPSQQRCSGPLPARGAECLHQGPSACRSAARGVQPYSLVDPHPGLPWEPGRCGVQTSDQKGPFTENAPRSHFAGEGSLGAHRQSPKCVQSPSSTHGIHLGARSSSPT